MPSYTELIHRLYHVNLHQGVKLGLKNMQRLSLLLGNPEEAFCSVHVAGTNGKGSVSTKIAKAYEFAGWRTGLYTSPHLSCFRERIQVNGELIPEEAVIAILTRIFELVELEKIPATFFEITTALAFTYFAQQDVDIAIIETGLGGRLDATNMILPRLSIITSISLEHTEILGSSLEEIAREKGGIIKPGIPILIGPRVPKSVIESLAKEKGSRLIALSEPHQVYEEENQTIARAALSELSAHDHLPHDAIEKGLAIRPPCRFEIFTESRSIAWAEKPFPPAVILDVAHNPDGFKQLFQALKMRFPQARFRIVLGLSKSKDIASCLTIIAPLITHLHVVNATNGRALPIDALYQECLASGIPDHQLTVHSPLTQGLETAFMQGAIHHDIVVVCGTFFIMREARDLLGIEEPRDPLDLN